MVYNFKKTILFDLDGVLNTYDGKYDKNYIPPIKDGAFIPQNQIIHKYLHLVPSQYYKV